MPECLRSHQIILNTNSEKIWEEETRQEKESDALCTFEMFQPGMSSPTKDGKTCLDIRIRHLTITERHWVTVTARLFDSTKTFDF